MDKFTKEQRSNIMKAIRSKNSLIELKLRKALWAKGLRYKIHYKKLVGNPDIVFVSKRIAIFCDSEFWHGYDWKLRKSDIKTNKKFWIEKIERNMQRDQKVNRALKKEGWIVLRFWGNQIQKNTAECVKKTEKIINSIK